MGKRPAASFRTAFAAPYGQGERVPMGKRRTYPATAALADRVATGLFGRGPRITGTLSLFRKG